MRFTSFLLTIASLFTIYIGISLTLNAPILGGIASTTQLYTNEKMNSFLVNGTIICGFVGLIIAIFGFATSINKDRCSVCIFSVLGVILLIVFGASGGIMTLMQSQGD